MNNYKTYNSYSHVLTGQSGAGKLRRTQHFPGLLKFLSKKKKQTNEKTSEMRAF